MPDHVTVVCSQVAFTVVPGESGVMVRINVSGQRYRQDITPSSTAPRVSHIGAAVPVVPFGVELAGCERRLATPDPTPLCSGGSTMALVGAAAVFLPLPSVVFPDLLLLCLSFADEAAITASRRLVTAFHRGSSAAIADGTMIWPKKAPIYLGGAGGRFTDDSGFLGSIAGLKTFDRALSTKMSACLYEQDQGHVGLCAGDPRGLMFEAEFTCARDCHTPSTAWWSGPFSVAVG